jgi:serine/threonine protein kinase
VDGWKTELTSLKQLHHPNIIRFLGAIFNPSPLTYCLVLEFCDGGDLSAALEQPTPSGFVLKVALDVASGLYYLHKKKLIHRDIKPSNCLLQGDVQAGKYTAKLSDFGLAAVMQVRKHTDCCCTVQFVCNTTYENEFQPAFLISFFQNSSVSKGEDLTAETGTYR